MRNHRTHTAMPVSCRRCEAVTTANSKQSPPTCSECGSEEVVSFTYWRQWRVRPPVLYRWGDLKLFDSEYSCPKCGEYKLRFGTNASGRNGPLLWD